MELDLKYRPTTLDDVVGQPDAINIVKGFGENIPKALMLYGQTGCGKTTIARILASQMDVNEFDLFEINCGIIKSPLETVRDIKNACTAATHNSKRVWILDEVQTFSRNKGAQEALLKVLENEQQPDMHFMLCTTDPPRLLSTIRGRCVKVPLKAIKDEELKGLIKRVAKAEKLHLEDKVIDQIVHVGNGSARDCLKELQKIAGIPDTSDQLSAVGGSGVQKAAFDLVKALLPFSGQPSWVEAARVLSDVKEEDPEGIRQIVLASARTVLLKQKSATATAKLCYRVIENLDKPFYDRASGHALLASSCFAIVFTT